MTKDSRVWLNGKDVTDDYIIIDANEERGYITVYNTDSQGNVVCGNKGATSRNIEGDVTIMPKNEQVEESEELIDAVASELREDEEDKNAIEANAFRRFISRDRRSDQEDS